MDLNSLLIFAKVAEYQSFTKAATALSIEKSTVSTKVSQLERHLGIRLLNRTTRLVSLTEAGDAYYQYCRQIEETANEAERFAQTLNDEPQGVLRISAPMDFSQLLVQQLIHPFMSQWPKVKIDLVVLDREVDLVAERFDVALRIGPGSLKDSSLIAKKLFKIKMGVYASPTFLQALGEPMSVTDLLNYPLIFFSKQQETEFKFSSTIFPNSDSMSGNLRINDMLTCKESAIAGLGIALLPDAIASVDVTSGKLKQVMPDFVLPSMNLFAVYPSRQWIPAKLTCFLEYLSAWKV